MYITKDTLVKTVMLLASTLDSMNIVHDINDGKLKDIQNSLDTNEIYEVEADISVNDKMFTMDLVTDADEHTHLFIIFYYWYDNEGEEDYENEHIIEICNMNDDIIQAAQDMKTASERN